MFGMGKLPFSFSKELQSSRLFQPSRLRSEEPSNGNRHLVTNQFYAKPSGKVKYCNLFSSLQIFFTMAHECEYCGLTFQRLFNLRRQMERRHNRSHEDYDSDMSLAKKPHTSDEESVDNDSPTDSEYESSTEMS